MTKPILNSHLSTAGTKDDVASYTHRGMANWGVGPRRCRDCTQFRVTVNAKSNQVAKGVCAKGNGTPFPDDAFQCRHFEVRT